MPYRLSYWSALTLFILLAAVVAPALPTRSAPPAALEYSPDEVVVKLFKTADLAAVARAYGLEPTPLAQFGSRPIYRLRIGDGAAPPVKASALQSDVRVEYAEPNYTKYAPEGGGRRRSAWAIGGDAGDFTSQWAPDRLRLEAAHSVTQGAGVTVAVLDTGVDFDHPALAGRLRPGKDFVNPESDGRELGVYGLNIGYGHGTHVAGLVALAAPAATILPVRVLDPDGVGNIWVLAEALAYAVDPDGDPATDDGAQVINLSLGTLRRTSLLDEIVAEITCDDDDDDNDDDDDDDDDDDERCERTGGTVVVAAAGNEGDTTPFYPAAEGVSGMLSVAASTRIDTLAAFSTRGSWVAVAAPGEEILSSVPLASGSAYGSWSGTSMAAPLVAGTAALVRAASPDLDAGAVTRRIRATALPLCTAPLRRIDAAAALGLPATERSPCHSAALPLVLR